MRDVARDDPLSETDILAELEPYVAYKRAYRQGKRGSELTRLSPAKASARSSPVVTVVFHGPLAILIAAARAARAHRTMALLAKARIATDHLSYEPRSCGWNDACTNLGLALLARDEIAAAIRCLDASWHVHPCPHNSSFGLTQRLAVALKPYPEARLSLEQYERISRRFVDET